MDTIKLKVMRPLYWAGTARAVDGILSVDALTASQLVASGRARLLDPNDIKLLLDAESEHSVTVCTNNQTFMPRGPHDEQQPKGANAG